MYWCLQNPHGSSVEVQQALGISLHNIASLRVLQRVPLQSYSSKLLSTSYQVQFLKFILAPTFARLKY
ncbi:uncharacterized protein CANTADRAFT_27495 [Suhomyces tanzawaensis NRRL Y-17324]|uniref:Uncharacterized protein n=1 Tax=Suhomyces tanzawaensis NRRL Y-17324 TaxID=984487 RepID=A0A1E4SC89_9ASCO|nr:uncharacterized protein CANTADRAFT_27495 [Suhomyces tanzawaensis NRRL Y-17324]ODV77130.1 hypothetical protein CANTADRAFT_27495 [Suhomyces tanzawaensis NRRL Y-17324]